jgi:ATP-binding cassette subfamily B protein
MQGRTVIAIAHRLTTVRHFDRILVIEAGQLIQDGAPDDLATTYGPYRDLVQGEARRMRARAHAA